MASITSTVAGTTVTYVITDMKSNTLTLVASAPPAGVTYTSSGALLTDGQQLLAQLELMLQTGLRPQVIAGTPASFTN